MPEPADRWRRVAWRRAPATLTAVVLLVACVAEPSPTPTRTPPPSATSAATPSAASPTPSASPSPTPEPALSLELPDQTDERTVAFAVTPQVSGSSGQIVVSVTNPTDADIREILLRWPTELSESLSLAPFMASEERIRDGGPPLVQPWSRWVLGPGESGEPDGTVTLGYGPLGAGVTLDIPVLVIGRTAPGPVAFDLQLLAADEPTDAGAILMTPDGEPAETRVEVP